MQSMMPLSGQGLITIPRLIMDARLSPRMTPNVMSAYWVYILTNKPRSTLYVGVTRDLVRRVYEHRENLVKGFTQRYGLKMLVYFEKFDTPQAAIQREKNIKHWSRVWKLQLVEAMNPQWRDLYNDIAR